MLDILTLTIGLSFGNETLDTPFGNIDADLQQQTALVEYENFVIGGQKLMLEPDLGPKYESTDFLVGYSYNGVSILGNTKGTWQGQITYPLSENVVLGYTASHREKVDRQFVTVGYSITDQYSLAVSYGLSEYDNFDGDFTAVTVVGKF